MQDTLFLVQLIKMKKYYRLTNNKLHLVIVAFSIEWDCPFQGLPELKLIMI